MYEKKQFYFPNMILYNVPCSGGRIMSLMWGFCYDFWLFVILGRKITLPFFVLLFSLDNILQILPGNFSTTATLETEC